MTTKGFSSAGVVSDTEVADTTEACTWLFEDSKDPSRSFRVSPSGSTSFDKTLTSMVRDGRAWMTSGSATGLWLSSEGGATPTRTRAFAWRPRRSSTV